MAYTRAGVERAMKVQEVILRAIDGQLTWVQAADILGYSLRTIRRIRWRLRLSPGHEWRQAYPTTPCWTSWPGGVCWGYVSWPLLRES